VKVGLKYVSMLSSCFVHVTFTDFGLNPDDVHLATVVTSLYSNTGPMDLTVGCDGGSTNTDAFCLFAQL